MACRILTWPSAPHEGRAVRLTGSPALRRAARSAAAARGTITERRTTPRTLSRPAPAAEPRAGRARRASARLSAGSLAAPTPRRVQAPRDPKKEYSSVSLRRLTSSSTAPAAAGPRSAPRTADGQTWAASFTRRRSGTMTTARATRATAAATRTTAGSAPSQPRSRPHTHFDDAQCVAAQEQPELRFRITRGMVLGEDPDGPGA